MKNDLSDLLVLLVHEGYRCDDRMFDAASNLVTLYYPEARCKKLLLTTILECHAANTSIHARHIPNWRNHRTLAYISFADLLYAVMRLVERDYEDSIPNILGSFTANQAQRYVKG